MKKFYAIALGAVVLFAGCSENLEVTPEIQKTGVYATIQQPEVPVSVKSLDWNANKFNFTWSEGEKVVVFGGKDVAAFNTLNAGSETSELQSTGFKLQDGVDYYACIPAYVFNTSNSLEAMPVSLLGQRQSSNNNTDNLKYFNYACAAATKVEGSNSLSFNLKNQVSWIVLEHTFTESQNVLSFNIATDEAVFPIEGTMNVKTSTFTPTRKQSVISLQVGDTQNSGLSFQAGETFRGFITVAPVDLTGKTLTISATLVDGNSLNLGSVTAKGAISANKPVVIRTSGTKAAVVSLDGVEYASLQEAISASQDGQEIVFLYNITTPSFSIPAGKKVSFNLNGKTISVKGNETGGGVIIKGDLTITGSSGFFGDSTGESVGYLFNIDDGATVTIDTNNDVTFQCGLSCVQMQGNTAKIIINGGKWIGGEYSDKFWTLNKLDAYKDSQIIIKGGEFYKFNPAEADTENPIENWVADGYGVIKNGDWYKVVTKAEVIEDNTINIENQLSVKGSTATVSEDVEVNCISTGSNVTLNLENGAVITGHGQQSTNSSREVIMTSNNMDIKGSGKIVADIPNEAKQSSAVSVMGGTVNIYSGVTLEGGSGNQGNYAVKIRKGTVNIYGGYFHSSNSSSTKEGTCEVIYLESAYAPSSHAYLNIYDGVFETDGDATYLINCNGNYIKKCHVAIYGGTFVGFNPADNSADGEHTNYVADGYVSTQTTYNGKIAWVVTKK